MDEIRELLQTMPKPTSVAQIAKACGVSYATASKWVTFMEGAGEVTLRQVGNVNAIVEVSRHV